MAGLMFEYVAIREILPNEEVVLDYGREWEFAWQKHVEGFSPPPESQNYKSAFRHMNEDKYFPTKEDETSGGNKQKLSNNIVVTCIYKNVWKNRGLAYDGE